MQNNKYDVCLSVLKDAEHAKALRERFNACFELANLPETTEEERRRLLNFVVVSAGLPFISCWVACRHAHNIITRAFR